MRYLVTYYKVILYTAIKDFRTLNFLHDKIITSHSTNGFNSTPQFFVFAGATVISEISGLPLEIADAIWVR